MKIAVINASPRKKCNTAQMLDSFVNGVKEVCPSAETEHIHLYDYGIMKHLQNIKLPIISFALEVEFSYYLLCPL